MSAALFRIAPRFAAGVAFHFENASSDRRGDVLLAGGRELADRL
jgi:hypothetical protein